jgi:DNA-binding MarR family transcriptional regulator
MNNFPHSPLPERLALGLAKIGLAWKTRSWRLAAPHGLTPTQGQILAALRPAGPEGRTLGELAEGLGVRPPTASEAVGALERKGLVRRRQDPDDGRAVRIALTRRGRGAARRCSDWPEFLAEAAGELSEAEQKVLLGALIKLIRRMQERGEIPVARMCVQCRYFRAHVYRDAERPHHCDLVDAPFGEGDLRLDCPDFQPVFRGSAGEPAPRETQRRQMK